jgi:UDP:flavonoid glycosyltransferase YjiC (YdhE family)
VKILFASMPADGHFEPLTPIATHLAGRGHDVRWYAGPRYVPKVDALGMAVFPYVRAIEVTGDNLNELYPERQELKGPKLIAFDLEKFFVANVENHFLDIAEIRDTFDFDVFFCDGAVYAEKLVAECLGVPVFAVGLPTVIPGPGSPPPFFGLRPARTVVGRTVHAVVRRMLASTMKPGVAVYNELLASHGLAPIASDGFPDGPMAAAGRVFLNGSPGLEFPHYRPPANAEFVGHLVPARGPLDLNASLPPVVLEPGSKVVAVSQGTVDNTDPSKLIVPTLEALKDTSNIVVATTGGARTEELRRRFARPNVVIEDFIDYDALFPHVDVFVSNGGYGSILTALHHGVPVVGAGKREGKNDNNARIAYNHLGVDLRSERPKPARVAAAVREVLDSPKIRAGVIRLRRELDSYDPMAIIEAALLDDAVTNQS